VIVEHDVPLGPLTTYRVGGAAARFARIEERWNANLQEG